MATNNSVNVPLSGNIGTVKFAGTTSPTFITPVLGAATATSVAFSPTTGGLIGTTAADNASAGTVGEFISSQITAASPVSYTTSGTVQNLTSISLTAGDWDVWGNIYYTPAGSTVLQRCLTAINTTTHTLPDNSLVTDISLPVGTGVPFGTTAPMQRINVSGAATAYMIADALFTTSTLTMCGIICARRVR